jgi:hypothetical protein
MNFKPLSKMALKELYYSLGDLVAGLLPIEIEAG